MGERGWGDVGRSKAERAVGSSVRGPGSERFLPEGAKPGRVARRAEGRGEVCSRPWWTFCHVYCKPVRSVKPLGFVTAAAGKGWTGWA